MNRFVFIVPAVALGCGYRLFLDYRHERRIGARLRARPQLTDQEFGNRYFTAEQAPIATQARLLLKRYVPFRIGGLHPSDTFADDLQIARFSRTAMVEFLMAVETCFGVTLRHRQDIVIRTFEDVVHAVARERGKKRPPNRLDGSASHPTGPAESRCASPHPPPSPG